MLNRHLVDDEDFYPYYSEEPVTESDVHRRAGVYLDKSLQRHFRDRPDVYVSANMFVYYQRGDRDERKVSPDVFVCFGATKRDRKSYRTWEEGVAPQVVFEITSESSRLADQGDKRAKYTAMGVEEYYLFDPWGEWIPSQFRAYRREGDELVPQVTGESVISPRLGLRIQVEGTLLRLIDPQTGKPLPTDEELERASEELERASEELERTSEELRVERRRRQELEEELRRLRSQQ